MFRICLLLLVPAAFAQTQIERGETLYLNAEKGCGTCHALKGKGTAVGPDLSGIGRLAPAAIAMAARSTVTQYVEMIKPKDGEAFPAFTVSKEGNTVNVFDMSKNPPEKKTLTVGEFTKSGNDKWKHPPSVANIDSKDLADIIGYIKFAASGSRKAVDPADVQ